MQETIDLQQKEIKEDEHWLTTPTEYQQLTQHMTIENLGLKKIIEEQREDVHMLKKVVQSQQEHLAYFV